MPTTRASEDGSLALRPAKTVLLTGATGFVGRQAHRALVASGHSVRAVLRAGTRDRLAAEAESVETPDLFAEDAGFWAEACHGADTVLHAAWIATPGRYLEAPENLDCLRGSLALARGAAAAGVRHVIGVGTCLEYAPSARLTVDAPLAPTTLYAACKSAAWETLGAYFARTGTSFSWARLFHLHGEDEHPDRLVPYIRRQLARGEPAKLTDGAQLRDFLDVAEAGAMLAEIVATGQPGAINICSGRAVTVRQLAERVADAMGRRDLLRFGAAAPRPGDPPAIVGVCNLAPWKRGTRPTR